MNNDADMFSDSSSTTDIDMYSATSDMNRSDHDPGDRTVHGHDLATNGTTVPAETTEPAEKMDVEPFGTKQENEPVPASPSLDLLDRINGMYRLLDLINEQGSGGIVDKIIIAQDSIARFANDVHDGSYRTLTHVDFRALDTHTIKPLGVYGSIPAIVDFLDKQGCIDAETRSLLLTSRSEQTTTTRSFLRPGLYLLDSRATEPDLFHVIFWPEDGTWQDGTISSVARNRVTFMRYLTKLCDQLVCLISEEHSANLVWKEDQQRRTEEDDEPETFEAYDRLFAFSVQQTNEEEETATAKEGFTLSHSSIEAPPVHLSEKLEPAIMESLGARILVGEMAQAILNVQYLPKEIRKDTVDESIRPLALENKLQVRMSPNIVLADELNQEGLKILLENGLSKRLGDFQSEWKAKKRREEQKLDNEKIEEKSKRRKEIVSEVKMLESGFSFYLVKRASEIFPYLSEDAILAAVMNKRTDGQDVDPPALAAQVQSWMWQNSVGIMKEKELDERLRMLESARAERYDTLKRRLRRTLLTRSEVTDLTKEQTKALVRLITSPERNITSEYKKIMDGAEKGMASKLFNAVASGVSHVIPGLERNPNRLPELPFVDDPHFMGTLDTLASEQPEYTDAIKEIQKEALSLLSNKIMKLVTTPHELGRALQEQMEREINTVFDVRSKEENARAWAHLKSLIQEHLKETEILNGGVFLIRAVEEEPNYYSSTYSSYSSYGSTYGKSFRIRGSLSFPSKARLQYSLMPLEVKQDDILQSSKDPSHVCRPVIRAHPPPPFALPLNIRPRFFRLLGKDRCLAVFDTGSVLQVYLEHVNQLAQAISGDAPAKKFYWEKIGDDCLFAVDEAKKLFVMLSTEGTSAYLYVFAYDPETRVISSRGGRVNISRWYSDKPNFAKLVFVSGTEELLLIERNGTARIFSLITENFRPSSLDLDTPILSAFSSPDGACLIVSGIANDTRYIKCFHWSSFGTNDGIEIEWPSNIPPSADMAVSSLGQRNATHLLFLNTDLQLCQSLLVQITQKSSEFTFRSDAKDRTNNGESRTTVNNSLIDCHAEVWTRFPVYAAIRRETTESAVHYPRSIIFVSSSALSYFSSYFSMMVRDFETKTRKPTKGILRQIKVDALSSWDTPSSRTPVSELQTGDWLMGLFCLIPIHLAVTNSNRFHPLKDGVISPDFERKLLGANVAQISESLSFGWYESIFSSYLARKPVKVVTSMGEQSVGKSFALNHFVDTSFAGSAMRCTEGVWLSVTPTRDYLVVAMDFEGVHSIERSAQEDTLLVLLNAAISNLVVFRNNFALSRDIAGLFTSFQSCSTVLDPASNPSLFNATLEIVIKDVIDSDTREIVNEFQQKFQRIVQEERGDNFITRLHKGKLDIIPWPVIENSRFYELFGALKLRLDRQATTHKHAGAFIGVLKMLMAKLKANDWGALDSNLAVQRSEYLSSVLRIALTFGTVDPINGDPLKNLDTDEILDNDPTPAILYLEASASILPNDASVGRCLKELRRAYPALQQRFKMSEEDFVQGMQQFLQQIVDARIASVGRWLKVNTERFGEKAEITALFREFDTWSKELRQSVGICGLKCSSCGLLCLEHKQHEGEHNCRTSHKCPHVCSFSDQHDVVDVPECSMPAGHEGRHVCSVTPHLCDLPCALNGKDGCLRTCFKPMGHEDDEHVCASRVHACGEPCSLVKPDGTPICSRTCIIDCRREHTQHSCDRSMACPIKCQLCNSFCAVPDHFHPLEKDAVHLCGQQHICRSQCQRSGICEIATTPQSIESTFVGKHATYQYTKFTQEARRLPCVVPIAPDELKHAGPHIHSLDPTAFHYCEEKCKQCGYYCTLPLGHPQNEHETSHGSMSQTEWVVEGDDDVVLDGRKYATGDSGAPQLCSLFCKSQGRHVHLDTCRADDPKNCHGAGIEHKGRLSGVQRDWVTHRLFWARSGFKDPYTNTEQAEFDLCDHQCGGDEHDANINTGAMASFCTLPMFHPPADPTDLPKLGHVSQDGHVYNCKNPALMQRSFHIFFALDKSGSMTYSDRKPLRNTPVTQRIAQRADNRFGAVLSSLYSFWTARDTAVRAGAANGMRRDAYTLIPFDSTAKVALANDTAQDPDQLLNVILQQADNYGGTNFTHALQIVQQQMQGTWSTERSPVVVFLSDGECPVADDVIYDLCRAAVSRGKPLAFHAVSFGQDSQSQYLRRMATIAGEVYASAPRDPLAPANSNPCSYTSALDTIQLANTFMSIAESLRNPRAALSRI